MEADSQRHWFALKSFYKGVFYVEEKLKSIHIETYLPCEDTLVVRPDGGKRHERKPIISSLLFFRGTMLEALEVRKMLRGKALLYFRKEEYKEVPIIISDYEMNIFMLVTSAGEKGLEPIDLQTDFTRGEHVRVIDGKFKGAEGYIFRVKKTKKLIVSISGICAVATTYIPREFLMKME